MATEKFPTTPAVKPAVLHHLDKAMEVIWLTAVALVPLAVLPDEIVVVGFEAPKIFLLRTAAIVLGLLTTLRWWLAWASLNGIGDVSGEARRLLGWTSHSQGRFVGFGAFAVLAVVTLATVLSPVPHVSTWGVDIGLDTTALANTAAYLVLFGVMVVRLRGRPAVDRLLWILVVSATVVALVGIGQALLGYAGDGPQRIGIKSTIGNPVFLGSYFAITIPVTFGLVLSARFRWAGLPDWSVGAFVLLPQVVAVGLTGTRGSLLSLALSIPLIVVLLAWVGGKPAVKAAGLVLTPLVVVAALGLAIGATSPAGSDLARIMGRYLQLPSELGQLTGSAADRTKIWEQSWDVFLHPRWPDSEEYLEIPALLVEPIRPLIGYGPEVFRYAYLQSVAEDSAGLTFHAHSFVLHTAVELGVLGVVGYGGLVLAVAWLLLRLVRQAKDGNLSRSMYLAVGLFGALASRTIEQVTGKAQVSDLTLSWALAALVVALVLSPERNPVRPSVVSGRDSKELSLGHVLPMVGLLGASILFWWHAVFSPLVSLTYTANAVESQARGDVPGTLESFDSAIRWSSGVAVNHIGFTSFLISGVSLEELGFSSTRDGLVAAHEALVEILERNPLDYRAWDFRRGIVEELVRKGLVDQAVLDRIDEIQGQLVRLPIRSATPER